MGTKGIPQERSAWDEVVKQIENIIPITVAGSYRRGKEICNDLDVIMLTEDGVIPSFLFSEMEKIGYMFRSRGTKQAMAIHEKGYQVDLYATSAATYGSMLIHLTGSQTFNVGMRGACVRKGYSFSQHGLFTRETKELIAADTEEAVFNALGCSVIPPGERDNYYVMAKKYSLSRKDSEKK